MHNTILPRHIAIVMDGNGRWATQRALGRIEGHKKGAEVLREITQFCAKIRIEYLTLYAFSTENWKRPKSEVHFLMKLLKDYLVKERKTYLENQIAFRTIGDISVFSSALQNEIHALQDCTQKGEKLTQILALNYGSKNEIIRACQKILKQGAMQEDLNEERLESALDTADFPDVDMFIRTGGEKRLSNFLLWQSSYAELFFSDTLWPDFTPKELEDLINAFGGRQRRFGGI